VNNLRAIRNIAFQFRLFIAAALAAIAFIAWVALTTNADTKRQEASCRQHSGVLVLAVHGEPVCVLEAR
jgi:hypothetical protein